jgi:hypothetical protein
MDELLVTSAPFSVGTIPIRPPTAHPRKPAARVIEVVLRRAIDRR